VDYQRFRNEVRQTSWQQAFLAQPLAERLDIAHGMRQRSEQLKSTQTDWVDVDNATALKWLTAQNCSTLIHGHTHQPAHHALDGTHSRVVLSDWEANASPPRLQVLRAQRDNEKNGHSDAPVFQSILLSN
jgi:UDP-2,3-diacylglucosamine hydrolase